MTIAVDCKDCGTDPTAECPECGAVYRLPVKRVVEGNVPDD